MLRLKNVDVFYGKLRVLKRVSLHVNPGEVVSIIGGNGAGKSTLLKTISGLVRPRSGEIAFQGGEIGALSPEKRVFMGCTMIPEGRQLFATLTVKENLLLGGYVRQKKGKGTAERNTLGRMYEIFPILRQREGQLAGTLSGGEQQMLAMARALMAEPALITMDEPSMGLAPKIVKEIYEVIAKLKEEGNTVLLVEQNAKAALRVSDRGYVIETGRIVMEGSATDLMANRDVQRAYLGRDLDAEVKI